jgi:hypothetical protein
MYRSKHSAQGDPMTPRLISNRNYRLLWGSQALSEFGLSTASIAFPLLVLAVTGSRAVNST